MVAVQVSNKDQFNASGAKARGTHLYLCSLRAIDQDIGGFRTEEVGRAMTLMGRDGTVGPQGGYFEAQMRGGLFLSRLALHIAL